jgi:hypothetical protein
VLGALMWQVQPLAGHGAFFHPVPRDVCVLLMQSGCCFSFFCDLNETGRQSLRAALSSVLGWREVIMTSRDIGWHTSVRTKRDLPWGYESRVLRIDRWLYWKAPAPGQRPSNCWGGGGGGLTRIP